MKFWSPLPVVLFFTSVLAAYSNADLRQIMKAKARSGVMHLSDENFEKVLYGHRDFHAIVFLSSNSPQLNCLLCREFKPDYDVVADSYAKAYPNGVEDGKDVYFFSADYTDSRKLFQLLKLDLIPKVFHFRPNLVTATGASFLSEYEPYQFYQGNHAPILSQWVTLVCGHPFELVFPVDYSRIALNAIATFTVVVLCRKFSKQIGMVLKSPMVWGVASIVGILLCISGHMFNQIRGTPFVKEKGPDVEFIASSPQMQNGIETQIVSTFYGLTGLLFVVLASKVSKIGNAKVQFIATAVVCFGIFVMYGLFLNVFIRKYRGYPFVFFEMLLF